MRNNVIALSILTAILAAEAWIILSRDDGFFEYILSTPGECRGVTTRYDHNFGVSRWDCDGNRLPDERQDNVDTQIP